MALDIPPEPIELKAWMLSLKQANPEGTSRESIDWDSFVIWSGNKLPKFLWDHWKAQLKPRGLTWQKFMRVLRHRTDVGVLWYRGFLSWMEFVSSLAKLLEGPLAEGSGDSLMRPERPVDLAQWQIPPMREWERFECFCRDLWASTWNDPSTQRIGRSGQSQQGVDISGRPQGRLVGIQCKKKDVVYARDTLTKKEIQEIVEEAKVFAPPLSELIIAYIGKRDANLQQEARQITDKHRKAGLFAVSVASWDDILELLGDHHLVFKKYFGHQFSINVDEHELQKRIEAPKSETDHSVPIKSGLPAPSEGLARKTAQFIAESMISGEHDAEIDHARDLLNDLRPKEALEYLEKLEKRIWHSADHMRRFRVLTNKAAALTSLGQEEAAGKLFVEAFQYNSDDEKALCNRALGHVFLGQTSQAEEFARKVLGKNPSSARAYSILLNCASLDKSLESIIQDIPVHLRQTEDVAFAVAHAAKQRGELASAVHWLRLAHKDAEKRGKKNPDVSATLAATILESLMKNYGVWSGAQITPEDRERIETAIALLTSAINALTSETLAYRISWLANRSVAYHLIDQIDRALADMEAVLRFRPDDATMTKQYAVMLLRVDNQRDRAVGLLRTLVGNPNVPEAVLILASVLLEDGKIEEAKGLLESSITEIANEGLKKDMQRLLVRMYVKESNFARAREVALAIRAADPLSVLGLVDAAKIEQRAGDINTASRLLDEARGYVGDETPAHHIVELADGLYSLEKYPDAWPLYERVVDPRANTYLVEHLLYSYYRAGETEKGLAFSKRIPSANKSPFLVQVELHVLEDVGDLKTAAETAERYLEAHPEDFGTRIHLAMIWFRTNQLEKLDAFLDQGLEISQLPLDAGFQLVGLCGERERYERSLQIAYDLRRKYFDDSESHVKYVGAFLSNDHKLDKLLQDAEEANVGTVVRVTNDAGQDRWYILEDRDILNSAMGEIFINSPLGQRILGKKAGDEVVTAEGSIDKVVLKVSEIKNKYVHALHDSMRLLPEYFGDTQGLERVTFRTGTEEETQESIQKILGAVERRSQWVMKAEKFYRESKLTIGAFSHLVGRNPADMWLGLMGSKLGIKSCVGSIEERQQAFESVGKGRTVAIDITALLTADALAVLPVLEKYFAKLLVTQSTADLLLQAISERRGMSSRGYETIGKEDGGFVRVEVSAEAVERQIKHLEGLKKWVDDHCEITPLKTGLGSDPERGKKDLLGPAFLNTMLVAKEQGCPLYTDDFGTRMVARNDFGVEGFWTQVVLMCAVSNKQISEDEYNDAVIKLIRLGHRHTTVSGQVILFAAKTSNWSSVGAFLEVLATLRGTHTEIRSAVEVIVEFMYLLWQEPILEFQRNPLVMAALDVLTDQRDNRAVIRLVRAAVRVRFKLIPLAEARVQQSISAWEAVKISASRF